LVGFFQRTVASQQRRKVFEKELRLLVPIKSLRTQEGFYASPTTLQGFLALLCERQSRAAVLVCFHGAELGNLVLGTNCSFRFLSGGQKIPGEFRAASSAHFFPLRNLR
jgi:hypothetical protein